MLILPSVSIEPLEFWHPWNVVRSSRVNTCRCLYLNVANRNTGAYWHPKSPTPCNEVLCSKGCGHRRVSLLLPHLFRVLVPEPSVWITYVHAGSATRAFKKNAAQRARRASKKAAKRGDPPVEYAIFSTRDGWEMIIATADLSGRSPRWGGSWITGIQAYSLLRRSVCRVGVLERWPSFSEGRWRLAAGRSDHDDDGEESLWVYLGRYDREESHKRFEIAADEAEKRWGVRPRFGQPAPSGIPIDEWVQIQREAFGRD